MKRYAIGVDMGGTFIKLALVDSEGNIHQSGRKPTPKEDTPEKIAAGLVKIVKDFKAEIDSMDVFVEGIGFTVPHFFEGDGWIQRQTNNMPALEGYPLYPPLCEAFGANIVMLNDLSSAGIAEHMYGKGRSYKRMLLVAIGTGIATSMITEDGLVGYNWGSTGDTGHIIIDFAGGAKCSCGGTGCLEAVTAAPAIVRQAMEGIDAGRKTSLAEILAQKGRIEAVDVYNEAKKGDELGNDIFKRVGYFLGLAMTSYLHIFRPEVMVLGGGVAQASDLLLPVIEETINEHTGPWYRNYLQAIEISGLGTSGGAIGCASMILYPDKYMHR